MLIQERWWLLFKDERPWTSKYKFYQFKTNWISKKSSLKPLGNRINWTVCSHINKCPVIKSLKKYMATWSNWESLRFFSSKGKLHDAAQEVSWCQQDDNLIPVQGDISCILHCHCGMWLMLYLFNDVFLLMKKLI